MFKKLKVKIRKQLRLYLGIKDLEQELIDYKKETNKNIFNHERNLQWCSEQFDIHKKQISQFDDKVETIHNTVENIVHIGTDIKQYSNNREYSWAVICIEGKMNIVKFVDLDRNNAIDILHFLKQFEAGSYCIDTPCKGMFNDLWKF